MDDNQIDLPYQVRLDTFEGPLDLLLHLIKKNEINIYDIPIALITQQYLEYVTVMTSLNLNVAGDFLVMAATLVHIKSRMLLPADDTEADDDDGPDPREELVRRLLEYKQYKDAASRLDDRERLWREVFYREQAAPLVVRSTETLIEDVTLFDLVDSLQAILARTPPTQIIEIAAENLTVNDRMNAILDMLDGKESLTFVSLFEQQGHRLLIIVTFLALLELTRLKLVRVFQGVAFGPILVMRALTPGRHQELDAASTEVGWEGI
ncbi:MAG: segregation and condensation protein A [Nitrospiraceae bacterium]